jgi:hypothetical protein
VIDLSSLVPAQTAPAANVPAKTSTRNLREAFVITVQLNI